MELELAQKIADEILERLKPHCHQCNIAGSVRREKPEVKDIEFVLHPKDYQTGLFKSGVAEIIDSFEFLKGEMNYGKCKYAQRYLSIGLHPPRQEIKIDFFFADAENYGWIYALRTGSKQFNFTYLREMAKRGYKSEGGYIRHNGEKILIPDEANLFLRLGMKYVEPKNRI